VLNAKNHAAEAEIVSRAGQPGAVTIATNMAGRGTDIKLGAGVVYLDRALVESQVALDDKMDGTTLRQTLTEKPCGLHVIGTERHESRRIDRQLRGRCARQGDPGSSRFYVSLEDDLMRRFGSDRIAGVMEKFGLEEGQVLEAGMLNRSIERAQRRVEQHNFSIRKRTLEYDDVMNKQREIVYGLRSEIVSKEMARDQLYELVEDIIFTRAEEALGGEGEEGRASYLDWVNGTFPLGLKKDDLPAGEAENADAWTDAVMARLRQAYELKVAHEDQKSLEGMERHIMLQAIDTHWQEFLRTMDSLRQGVGLRAYGQQDPLVEYKKEAYTMFADLMDRIRVDVATRMFRSATSLQALESFLSSLNTTSVHDEVQVLGGGAAVPAMAGGGGPPGADAAMQQALQSKATPLRREDAKVGRNDPCPCGSGKKYKKCCGA
jgi:preprotein translocase subunit SecA